MGAAVATLSAEFGQAAQPSNAADGRRSKSLEKAKGREFQGLGFSSLRGGDMSIS